MAGLHHRLDQIIPKINEKKFIEGRGLGNEISFYVFDYEPHQELIVRDYIEYIKKECDYEGTTRRIIEFDLYEMLLEIAKERHVFERIFQMEAKQGKDALSRALENLAKPDVYLRKINEKMAGNHIAFLTGIGKVYPFIRAHHILNNLQDVLDKTPVIMFYPGKYDGQSLQLFSIFKEENYYRAFRLVD